MLAWSLMAACQSLLSTNGNDYKGLTMTTQSSKDGAMPSDGTHWEIHSRSLLCDGLPRELPTSKRPGSNRDVFAMAEINNLYIAMVHDPRIAARCWPVMCEAADGVAQPGDIWRCYAPTK